MSDTTSDITSSSANTASSVSELMMSLTINTPGSDEQDAMSTSTVPNISLPGLPAEIRNQIFLQSHVIKNKDGSMKVFDIKTLKFYWRRALGATRTNSILYNDIMAIFFGNHIFSFDQAHQHTIPGQYQPGRQTDFSKINGRWAWDRSWKGGEALPPSAHVFTQISHDGLHAQHMQVLPPHMMAQIRHAEINISRQSSSMLADAIVAADREFQRSPLATRMRTHGQHIRLAHWTAHLSDLHGLGFRELQSLRIIVDDPPGQNPRYIRGRMRELLSRVVHQVPEFEVVFRFEDDRTGKEYVAAEMLE